MRARRNGYLALITLIAFLFAGLAAAQSPDMRESTDATIDFEGFQILTNEVAELRMQRLVPLATFNQMAAEPNTIILDTRSRAAFEAGHIDGAVHLNFSDFTSEKLAATIPSRDTRILIYCNNNFTDDVAPVVVKAAPLALNVPTFVNLVGYGYGNVYELADMVSMADPAVGWISAAS